ncbi:hypothetical protein D3C71_27840 [compost metagenome]
MKQILLFFSLIILSCAAGLSDDQRMFNTVNRVTYCVSELNYDCIDKLSAYDLSNNGNGGVKSQMKKAYYDMKKYHNNKVDSLIFKRDTVYDNLGRLKFTVYLFDGFDSLTGVTHSELQIFVGPKDMYSLDKISDLQYVDEIDVKYREYLLKQGKLLETDELLKTIK